MQQEYKEEIDALEELERRRKSAERRAEMKREKERYLLRMKLLRIGMPVCLALFLAGIFVIKGIAGQKYKEEEQQSFPVTVQSSDAYKNVDSELSVLMEDEKPGQQADVQTTPVYGDGVISPQDGTREDTLPETGGTQEGTPLPETDGTQEGTPLPETDGTQEGTPLPETDRTQGDTPLSETDRAQEDTPAPVAQDDTLFTAGVQTELSASPKRSAYAASESSQMQDVSDEVVSTSAVVIDRGTQEIISQRDAKVRISPASMTKILTVLVAAEHVDNLNDIFTITREITDYGYQNDCSSAGFLADETVTVKDLFYGTILPSGADAAVGLATYVAGSQEAFVDMMNEKLKELGLSETSHFTNCVGIYDEQHYSTVYDIAMILEAAVDNELCREVLNARTYKTSATEQHPEGIIISNWFLRRIEDKDTHGKVLAAKTGYVAESGSCAASYAQDHSGNGYICVTGGSTSPWRCIYDHVALYQQFLANDAL